MCSLPPLLVVIFFITNNVYSKQIASCQTDEDLSMILNCYGYVDLKGIPREILGGIEKVIIHHARTKMQLQELNSLPNLRLVQLINNINGITCHDITNAPPYIDVIIDGNLDGEFSECKVKMQNKIKKLMIKYDK